MKNTLALIVISFGMFSVGCAAETDADEFSYSAEELTSFAGDPVDTGVKCKVVSGSNAGKTGTLDSEGWCMGPWGGTACKDSAGRDNGKCTSIKVAARTPVRATVTTVRRFSPVEGFVEAFGSGSLP